MVRRYPLEVLEVDCVAVGRYVVRMLKYSFGVSSGQSGIGCRTHLGQSKIDHPLKQTPAALSYLFSQLSQWLDRAASRIEIALEAWVYLSMRHIVSCCWRRSGPGRTGDVIASYFWSSVQRNKAR